MKKRLQVIYKIVERCNINCTYCYYFNLDNESAYDRPIFTSLPIAKKLAISILHSVKSHKIEEVLICFHGGEPMMIKPSLFDKICEIFVKTLTDNVKLNFSIQTNGTILNTDWILLFYKYKISIGVSIDGDKVANDKFRLSKNRKSTFKIVEKNIKIFNDLYSQGICSKPSTISVINPLNNYRKIYKYLRSIGIEQMSFLLPDENYDYLKKDNSFGDKFGKPLFSLYHSWYKENNPSVEIRHVNDMFNGINQQISLSKNNNNKRLKNTIENIIMVVRSDGSLAVNDSYYPTETWYSKCPVFTLEPNAVSKFLSNKILDEIKFIERTICEECKTCNWLNLCNGGDIENRWSRTNDFDNPSIFCKSYKKYYEKVISLTTDKKQTVGNTVYKT